MAFPLLWAALVCPSASRPGCPVLGSRLFRPVLFPVFLPLTFADLEGSWPTGLISPVGCPCVSPFMPEGGDGGDGPSQVSASFLRGGSRQAPRIRDSYVYPFPGHRRQAPLSSEFQLKYTT